MIPTLKNAHDKKLKQKLLELKTNPDLLQEYYDQRQLEKMTSTIKALSDVTSGYGANSVSNALMKAYADLEDHMSMSRVRRMVSLKSSLKDIEILTKGLINVFTTQLPHIVQISVGKMGNNMSSVDSLREILSDQENVEKFYAHVKKALKPGFFGVSNLPYIETDVFINELLELSPSDFTTIKNQMNEKFLKKSSPKPITKPTINRSKAPTPASTAPTSGAPAAKATSGSAAATVAPKDFYSLYIKTFDAIAKGSSINGAELNKIKAEVGKELYMNLMSAGYIS